MTEVQVTSFNILETAAGCFKQAQKNLIQGAAMLYRINSEKLWESNYSSFGEYVETECGISTSMASKLLKAYSFYAIEAKIPQQELESVDYEKLYLTVALKDLTPEEKLVRAKTWSRSEIKDELAQKDGKDCDHPETIRICSTCHKRVE